MRLTLHNTVSGFNVAANAAAKAVASPPTPSTSGTQSHGPQDPPGGAKPIVEALKEKLPLFDCGPGSEFTDESFFSITKASGQSTKLAKPPMAWIAEDMESFLKTYFTEEEAKFSVDYMAPQVEKSFRMSNEADVVRASALYLLNVVNIAGELLFPFSSKLHASFARILCESMTRITYMPSTLFRFDCLGFSSKN